MERNEEQPDRSYWTAYDHFMVEREARARRRRYVWVMLRRTWLRIVRHAQPALASMFTKSTARHGRVTPALDT